MKNMKEVQAILTAICCINQTSKHKDEDIAQIITTYESLKDFAIHMIQEDHLYLAMHILEAIHKAPADYYDYDYSMGTLEDPTPLTLTFDLLDYCDDGEDDDYEEF